MLSPIIIPMQATAILSANANVRQGAPNRQSAVLTKLNAGVTIEVLGIANGESISGNPHWYLTPNNGYLWSGACHQLVAQTLSAQSSNVAPEVRVTDLSHGDGVTDFAAARRAGLLGVIHKATTGATGRDDAYASRRKAARSAGLLWGAYHWGSAMPVQEQVENFLSWSNPDDQTLVALDYESSPGNQMTLDMARDFLQQINNKLGRKAVLYSGPSIKSDLGTTPDPFLGSHRLWLAEYGNKAVVQASWKQYWLWQYTDGESGPTTPRHVPGITGDGKGRLDCDHFDGDEAQLRQQWA